MESPMNWENLFIELEKAECELEKSINLLVEASDKSVYQALNHKVNEWRNLHSIISKNGKTIEKVLQASVELFLFMQFYRFIRVIILKLL